MLQVRQLVALLRRQLEESFVTVPAKVPPLLHMHLAYVPVEPVGLREGLVALVARQHLLQPGRLGRGRLGGRRGWRGAAGGVVC